MEPAFDISLYNDEFFKWHSIYAHEYSVNSMNRYIDLFKPRSVCDFGCGIGSYLFASHTRGLANLKGFDIGGEFARKYTPEIVQPYIEYTDCTKPIITTQKYDCVISFETAEHIEPVGTDIFIDNIVAACSHQGTILFTAAPPGQEGCGHINCHPKIYWMNHFFSRGMLPARNARYVIVEEWRKLNVPAYITENLLVFIKPQNYGLFSE